jgi:hypothetical protein
MNIPIQRKKELHHSDQADNMKGGSKEDRCVSIAIAQFFINGFDENDFTNHNSFHHSACRFRIVMRHEVLRKFIRF